MTLIGGEVFGMGCSGLEVVVNSRDLGAHVWSDEIRSAVQGAAERSSSYGGTASW
ncbi:MAG: hypothetical protein JW990_07840 [Thermoleophilia bacterium]|nr:hypothetical protein [Thermoleophilia bacterium]